MSMVIYYLVLCLLGIYRLVSWWMAGMNEAWFQHYSQSVKSSEVAMSNLEGRTFAQQWSIMATQGPELVRLTRKRDSAESAYGKWQAHNEWGVRTFRSLKQWRGKYTPYLLGKAEALGSVLLLDYLANGSLSFARSIYVLLMSAAGYPVE